jgi:hypothetical protein
MNVDLEEVKQSDEWTRTNPMSEQYVRELDGYDRAFQVYEGEVGYVSTHYVGSMTIYQVEKAIDGYYDSFQELVCSYEDTWPQIVAECRSEKNAPALSPAFD